MATKQKKGSSLPAKQAEAPPVVALPPPTKAAKKQKEKGAAAADAAAVSYRVGSLAEFLSTAPDLGSTVPRSPTGLDDEEDEDGSDDDGEGSDLSIDERVLMLRRFEEGDDDWVGAYAGSSEDDDDDGPQPSEDEDPEEGDTEGGDDDDVEEEEGEDSDDAAATRAPVKPTAASQNTAASQKAARSSKQPQPTITGRASQPRKGHLVVSEDAADALPVLRSSALTAVRAPSAHSSAPEQDRAAALAGIPVFRKEPLPAKRQMRIAPAVEAVPPSDDVADADAAPTRAAGRPPKPASSRPAVPAFVPSNPARCIYIGNLPHDASPEALRSLLGGSLKAVHLEVNNNGRPAGFGYAEFAAAAGASEAVRAASSGSEELQLGGRALRVLPYTDELNYRRPDGSRKREKKGSEPKQQQGVNPKPQHPGGPGVGKRDKEFAAAASSGQRQARGIGGSTGSTQSTAAAGRVHKAAGAQGAAKQQGKGASGTERRAGRNEDASGKQTAGGKRRREPGSEDT